MRIRPSARHFAQKFLDPLLAGMRRLSRYCAWAGGALFFAAALLITFEVFIRKVFSASTGGADELSGYGFAIATALAFAYALLERTHIRVDTGYLYLPPLWQALLDVVAAVLLFVFFALLLRYGWEVVGYAWRMDAHSSTPLHVPLIFPQLAWWLGLCLTVVVATLLLLRAVIHILLGELAASRQLIGTRGMEEEIADELAILGDRDIVEPTRR
jgi:TRAP-type C4-dicarboxylate transport system permease small subunit